MTTTRSRGSAKTMERFSSVPGGNIPRSSFDRSFSHKTTIDSGFLYPIFVDEVLPGDTINLRPSFFCRMATPIKPYMDGLHVDWQFFYVPNRLLWDNFKKMMGEQIDKDDHIDYTIPQINTTTPAANGLYDYLGCPVGAVDIQFTALPARAYTHIWQEWFRDENLQDKGNLTTGDGPDTASIHYLRRRGKRKDYFSGALPFAQKGDAVLLPLGSTAPVVAVGDGIPTFESTHANSDGPDTLTALFTSSRAEVFTEATLSSGSSTDPLMWGDTKLETDLSLAASASINTMRVALTIQHLLEADARGGTRYRELVKMHFGVDSDDLRLDRPELLATGSMPIQVNPVAQSTIETGSASEGLGDLSAYATGNATGRGFVKSFKEHGIVMGLVSVRAELSYQQGIPRWMTRKTRYDFFWPLFQGLGEQAVLSREIYMDGTGDESAQTGDWSVWGYQPRYEEYRHRPSMITGEFRSTFAQSLDVWHLGLDFDTRPVLNAAFIEESPHVDRVVKLTADPEFLLDAYFKVTHVRPMARYATPGIDRF